MGDFMCYSESDVSSDRVLTLENSKELRRLPLGEEAFPGDAIGVEFWQSLVDWWKGLTDDASPAEVRKRVTSLFREHSKFVDKLLCPRLFISHRSVDAPYALAIGKVRKKWALTFGSTFWIRI